jgi:hypothetical protein
MNLRPYAIGLGFTFLGGLFDRCILAHNQRPEITWEDRDHDDYTDIVVENNWRYIITNNTEYLKPRETLDPSYKICLFSEKIPLTEDRSILREQFRPVLEHCFKD